MSEFVFDLSKCPVDPVTPVSPDNIVKDDRVEDAPPDIPDCGPALPPVLPPEQCPVIGPAVQTKSIGFAEGSVGAFLATVNKGNCCVFALDYEMQAPCPELKPAFHSQSIFFTVNVSNIALTITKTAGCVYTFALSGAIHCPALTSLAANKGATTASPARITLIITKINDCDYEFDIDWQLPAGTGGGGGFSLTVQETDDDPIVVGVTIIRFEELTLPVDDDLGGQVTVRSKQPVRANSTGDEFVQRRINVIGEDTVVASISDDPGNDEVDINFLAVQPVRVNSAGDEFIRRRMNFIETSTVNVSHADDAGNDEVDVTIDTAGETDENNNVLTTAVVTRGTIAAGTFITPFDATLVLDELTEKSGSNGSATVDDCHVTAYTAPT